MDDRDVDRLLEQAFPGGGEPNGLRQRVLRDSTAALGLSRARRRTWRAAVLAAAAVLVAAVSFLSGRASVLGRPTTVVVTPPDPETTSVPSELVAWLEAARFFEQLGMDERVLLAYERAGRLLPQDRPVAGNASATMYAAQALKSREQGPQERPTRKTPVILAKTFGD